MICLPRVALRKESVDRNLFRLLLKNHVILSLSARRAWIEIDFEGKLDADLVSLSARRAWIEMLMVCQAKKYSGSLSARRAWIEIPTL